MDRALSAPHPDEDAMTLFVLLPAYNEEDSIPALVPKIFAALAPTGMTFRVILVDDGSRDRTAERVRELQPRCPVEVLTHPINRGLGETIRDGIEYCVREGVPGDIIVRLDCDDSQRSYRSTRCREAWGRYSP